VNIKSLTSSIKDKINFLIFIPIIIGLLINNFYTQNSIYKEIKNSKAYENTSKQAQKNQLFHITDIIKVKGKVSDNENIFGLKDVVILKKTVEMYSWVKKNKKFRYEHIKEWNSYVPELTTNRYYNPYPKKELGIFYYYPKYVKIGDLEIPIKNFKADKYKKGILNKSQQDNSNGNYYIYYGNNNLNNPQVGDIRIKYDVFEANKKTTLFFTFDNQIIFKNYTLKSFYGKELFLRLFEGDINSVYSSFSEEESQWKFIINWILAFILIYLILNRFIFSIYISIYNNFKKVINKKLDSN